MTNQDTTRYSTVGGLDEFIEQYRQGNGTLGGLAKTSRVSRETIRNDIKRHIGADKYVQLVAKRKEVERVKKAPSPLDIDAAQRHLAGLEKEVSDDASRKEYQAIRAVLGEMKAARVPLMVHIPRTGGFKYELPKNRLVQIRVGVVDESRKEHSVGFYRFKISPDMNKYAFTVFAVVNGREVLPFVFPTGDIQHVRSLNVRFKDKSKYDIKRESKYDYARRNWKPLTRAHKG